MKKSYWLIALLTALCILMLAGCGREVQAPSASGTETALPTVSTEAPSAEQPTESETAGATESSTQSEVPSEAPSVTPSEAPSMVPSDTPSASESRPSETPTEAHLHAFGDWTTVTPASCKKEGEQKRICACGEEEFAPIERLAHRPVDDPAIEATCMATGLTAGSHCGEGGKT